MTLGSDGADVIDGTGGDGRFGDVTVDTDATVTIHGAVTATRLLIGGTDTPATVNLNEALNLDNGADADVLVVNAVDVNFAGAATVTTGNGGDVMLTGEGAASDLVIAQFADFDLDGELVVDDFDNSVQLAANLTADEGITFQNGSDVTLIEDVVLDTDDTGGAAVNLESVDAEGAATGETLTISAGNGSVDVAVGSALGAANALGYLDITDAGVVTLQGVTTLAGGIVIGEQHGGCGDQFKW